MQKFSDHQLRLAAKLYYMDGLSQTEVSKYVNVSQAHVSRLLSQAQKMGIVRIFVDDYQPRDLALEETLKKSFKLEEVAVIKVHQGMPAENLRRAIGRFSGSFVTSLINDCSLVAISGGRTIREVIAQLPAHSLKIKGVLQAMGSIDANITQVDAQELGRQLAAHASCSFFALNSPAYMPDKASRDAFMKLDQIRDMGKRFNELDAALVGIGNMENSVFIERGVLAKKDLSELKAAGAVGEICGRFFDKNGKECATDWRSRVISIQLEQLQRTPKVTALVSGSDRTEAVVAAIRSGIIKCLVIDDLGAESLIHHEK